MGTDHSTFFLARVREWWAVAEALRGCGVPEGAPVLRVWREAAWCHLLFTSGHHRAAVTALRRAVADIIDIPPDVPRPSATEAEVISTATDLFARLRAAVSAAHPTAFARPTAA